MPVNQRNSELPSMLTGDFWGRTDVLAAIGISNGVYANLPYLAGFWNLGGTSGSNQAADSSGNGAYLDKTGAATINYGLQAIPVMSLPAPAAIGNYYGRVSDTLTAISAHLTLGAWIRPTTNANTHIMGRWAGGGLSYLITCNNGVFEFYISNNGAAVAAGVMSAAYPIDNWYFVVARFAPNIEISLFVDKVNTANAAGIPATIYSAGATPFKVGASTSLGFTGYIAYPFICRNYLGSNTVYSMFEASKPIFK